MAVIGSKPPEAQPFFEPPVAVIGSKPMGAKIVFNGQQAPPQNRLQDNQGVDPVRRRGILPGNQGNAYVGYPACHG